MKRLSLVLLAALACAEDDPVSRPVLPDAAATERRPEPGEISIRAIVSIVVTPNPAAVDVGANLQLGVAATNHLGTVLTNPSAAIWSTSNASVVTVSSSGVITGISVGTATVRAAALNGVYGETTVNVAAAPPPPSSETLLAAGDIAVCSTSFDEATSALLDTQPGTIAALGDLAYNNGTAAEFANCYDPSWGRHTSRTKPVPGNHEYLQPGAAPYYAYFGAAAGDPAKGYYSYDLGDWHIVALNSNCLFVSCAIGSAQETWLKADLAATSKACILAYWHHPRWSSDAQNGNNTTVQPLVRALFNAGADVLLSGHGHDYERFNLQDPTNKYSAVGIRQFVVGTGGRSPFYSFGTIRPNSQVRNNTAHGVLKLTLSATSYSWQFLPVAGSTFTDTGTQACH